MHRRFIWHLELKDSSPLLKFSKPQTKRKVEPSAQDCLLIYILQGLRMLDADSLISVLRLFLGLKP